MSVPVRMASYKVGQTQPGGTIALGLCTSFVWPYNHHYRAGTVFGGGVFSRGSDDLGAAAIPPQTGGRSATIGSERPDGIRTVANCRCAGSSCDPPPRTYHFHGQWLQRRRATQHAGFHVRAKTLAD